MAQKIVAKTVTKDVLGTRVNVPKSNSYELHVSTAGLLFNLKRTKEMKFVFLLDDN